MPHRIITRKQLELSTPNIALSQKSVFCDSFIYRIAGQYVTTLIGILVGNVDATPILMDAIRYYSLEYGLFK